MRRRSTKLEVLKYIIARTRRNGNGPAPVMTSDDYARDHVLFLCESLQLRLTRLRRDRDGYGYELGITRAGRLLAAGEIEGAAAALDAGIGPARLTGEPPEGALGLLLYPGGAGISLHGIAARQYAPELMRGVATGHLYVADGVIHAVSLDGRRMSAGSPVTDVADRPRRKEPATGMPSSRAARHVGLRRR